MNCPYCAETVSHGASVCKTCRRDLTLVVTLQEANHALEERVEELEAELAELRERGFVPSATAVPEEPPSPPGIVDLIVVYLILPTVVLIGTHYLLIVKFDTKLAWLRAASIVLPAVFGLMLDRKLHPRWYVTLGYGIVVAVASVLGMSTVVHFTDGDAILPDSAVAWRETFEYVTSISLSYLLGSLLLRVAQPFKLTTARRNSGMGKLAGFVAKHVKGKKGMPLEERIQRMVKLIQLGVSVSTALGAVYTGFKGVL